MNVKTILVTARASARDEKNKNLDTAVDAAVGKFLSENPNIEIDKYTIAADLANSFPSALVSILYSKYVYDKGLKK